MSIIFYFGRDSEKAREYWGRYINFDNSHIVGELVGFSVLAIVSLDWVTYCIWSLERASNKLTDDCTIINVWQISNFTFKTVYHVLHVCKVCYCRLIWSFLRPATSFLIAQIYIHFYAVLQICLWDSWRVCFNVRHADIDQWPLTHSGISHCPFQRYTNNSLLYIWLFLWDSDACTVFMTGSFADGIFSLHPWWTLRS